jgi:hypothetical protein
VLCAGAAVPTPTQEVTQQPDQQHEPADSRLNPGRFIMFCIVVNKNMNDKHTELSRACAGVTASSTLGQQPAPSDAQQDQGCHSTDLLLRDFIYGYQSLSSFIIELCYAQVLPCLPQIYKSLLNNQICLLLNALQVCRLMSDHELALFAILF